MDALHSDQRLTFLKNTAPFSAFTTLDPTRMPVNEVIEAFKLIVSDQVNNTRVLDFILTCKNIPHMRAVNVDDDDSDDIEELPDPERSPQVRFSE